MTAPWMIDGAMDGEMFLLWVQTQLAPVLRSGDVVILDNLPAHKPTAIREAIADGIDRITKADCRSYFTAAGYEPE